MSLLTKSLKQQEMLEEKLRDSSNVVKRLQDNRETIGCQVLNGDINNMIQTANERFLLYLNSMLSHFEKENI